MVETYIHKETKIDIEEFIPDKRKLSRWVSGSWKKAKQVLKYKVDDGFLILPMYLDELGNQNEWQCQISGKSKVSETIIEAVQREVLEEIGLAFNIRSIQDAFIDYERFKGCDVTYFLLNLKDSVDYNSFEFKDIRVGCKNRELLDDDKSRRISVYLYFDDINKKLLNRIIDRKRLVSSDDAGQVILLMDKKKLLKSMN
jgi:hypothetical protein